MKKYKVAIVSSGNPLESILSVIDFENIDICAVFGIWDNISNSSKNIFKKVLQPLDMLSINCTTCGAEYFLIDFPSDNFAIHAQLVSKGIDFKNILIMENFGSKAQFSYAYFKQWKYILKQPKLDFIVTGISYVREGFDIQTMLPWQGVNLARPSQDLYYSYKIAEQYLNSHTSPPKFCLIGLAP